MPYFKYDYEKIEKGKNQYADCDFSENYLDDLTYATDVVEDNSDELYQEIVRELLDAEFPSNEFRFIAEIADDFKKYSYENIR